MNATTTIELTEQTVRHFYVASDGSLWDTNPEQPVLVLAAVGGDIDEKLACQHYDIDWYVVDKSVKAVNRVEISLFSNGALKYRNGTRLKSANRVGRNQLESADRRRAAYVERVITQG